ncbi:fungal hydrophobin [Pluteus cervinus]|uniref:Fungal hydrophobin n=1 Tax=Pluteus cervinus TaxID=181527 RepID=A0ACD3A722_9AGAR|nr:fungal hydrophobin [Pluteus cervinus]
MRVATLLAIAATAAVPVLGAPAETNADRLARGLPPLPPVRRATPIDGAKRSAPSGTPPPACSTGPVQCCNLVGTIANSLIGTIVGLLGIVVGADVQIGVTCQSFSITPSCITQPVCCQNIVSNGLVAIGCSPINL